MPSGIMVVESSSSESAVSSESNRACSIASHIWSKITRIVYGATRDDVHSMYFDAKHLNATQVIADAYRDDIEVVGGVAVRGIRSVLLQAGR